MAAIRVLPHIASAIAARRAVVALESSVLAQGLPIPANREAAERMTAAVERAGGVPAITAVVRGTPTVGLEPAELERFLRRDGVGKVAARDLPVCIARRGDGATTVSATLLLARRAGISVFATGGIGGVHREPPFDESADLAELARTPMITVCAGAKSILDLRATLERLESLGVTVIGYRTSEMPGFFTRTTGLALPARADTPEEIVAVHRAARAIGREAGIVVMQPPPEEHALDAGDVERAVADATRTAREAGVRGPGLTPWLLAAVERATGGRSLGANLALLDRNAALAAAIAKKLEEEDETRGEDDVAG